MTVIVRVGRFGDKRKKLARSGFTEAAAIASKCAHLLSPRMVICNCHSPFLARKPDRKKAAPPWKTRIDCNLSLRELHISSTRQWHLRPSMHETDGRGIATINCGQRRETQVSYSRLSHCATCASSERATCQKAGHSLDLSFLRGQLASSLSVRELCTHTR